MRVHQAGVLDLIDKKIQLFFVISRPARLPTANR